MLLRNAVTVVLSVVLSAVTTLLVDRHLRHQPSDVIRAHKIELVDNAGQVRGLFELGLWSQGIYEPRFVIRDDQGSDAVNLQINPRGEGTLYFSSRRVREGIIRLGYLQFDDSGAPEDPGGGWGLVIQDSETNRTSMGLRNSGKPIGLSALTEKKQPAP